MSKLSISVFSDVVKDLPPVIKQFNESEANKTGKPTKDSFVCEAHYKLKILTLAEPINISNYIDQHLDDIKYLLTCPPQTSLFNLASARTHFSPTKTPEPKFSCMATVTTKLKRAMPRWCFSSR